MRARVLGSRFADPPPRLRAIPFRTRATARALGSFRYIIALFDERGERSLKYTFFVYHMGTTIPLSTLVALGRVGMHANAN